MPQPATPEAVQDEIARLAREVLCLARPVEPGLDFTRDLQLDSVDLLTLVVELERVYAIELRVEDAATVRTVADLAQLVARRAAERPGGAP